jgi:phage terminase large subunit-like protein
MHAAAERLLTDVVKADSTFTHDGCQITATHVRNARKEARAGERYVLAKPTQTQKIDAAMSSILAHEAAGDVTAAALWKSETAYVLSA